MKPQSCTLTYRQSTESGLWGWIPQHLPEFFDGVETYSKYSIRLLCHDILEHTKGDKGTPEEELQAIGAAMYGRGSYDYINFNSDLVFIFSESQSNLKKPRKPKYYDDYVTDYIEPLINLEKLPTELLEECDEVTEEQIQQFIDYALVWLVKGIIKAENKYNDSLTLNELFFNLSELLIEQLPRVDLCDKLRINIIDEYTIKTKIIEGY